MKEILEALFYGEVKCHEQFQDTEEFREANRQTIESLQKLETVLEGEDRALLRQLDDAHCYMNAVTALECYVDGFSTAAKLFSAIFSEE